MRKLIEKIRSKWHDFRVQWFPTKAEKFQAGWNYAKKMTDGIIDNEYHCEVLYDDHLAMGWNKDDFDSGFANYFHMVVWPYHREMNSKGKRE